MHGLALFLLLHGNTTREPASDFNQQFVGLWQVAGSSCGVELTDEQIHTVITKGQSMSHSGHINLKSDNKYSHVTGASRHCKDGQPQKEAIYMEGVYCGDPAQTDGTYKFLPDGTAHFDGKIVRRSLQSLIVAGIGLDEGWKKLNWEKKGEILVLIFPPTFNLDRCADKTMRRYHVKFQGS